MQYPCAHLFCNGPLAGPPTSRPDAFVHVWSVLADWPNPAQRTVTYPPKKHGDDSVCRIVNLLEEGEGTSRLASSRLLTSATRSEINTVLASSEIEDKDVGVVRADNHDIDKHIAGYTDLIKDAAQADQIEHEMGVRQALRIHKKAVFWSMALSSALIMEGYDVVLIASFYGHPAFLKKFGVPGPEGKNIIPAAWQSGLGNGSSAGGIIGLLINGWASEKFGPRRTFLVAMVLMIAAIFVPVFAQSLPVLVFGEVLCGIPWSVYARWNSRRCLLLTSVPSGIFQTLTTAYASEVCPIALRHYLTALRADILTFAIFHSFQQAGMAVQASYDLNLALNAMFVVGTFVSWGLLTRFGRRDLYLAGLATMAAVLLCIGGMGFTNSTAAKWVSGALLIFLNLAYNSTLGPVCYTLVAEISSTRLRAKTIALSRVAYQLMNIICGIIVPRQLSPAEWNWGPKSGLFWAGSAILTFVYTWFRIPETRNRSYGELDLLFEHRVPAWRFAKTKVDQFNLDERRGPAAETPMLEEKPDLKEDVAHAEYIRK
ncbi:hypothetical protein QFC22_006579 [Naganishia vaughanmartiniae]|uniref:Uncharacterized protein n=1 Tax=Naganishia vaughanmartiniae TaxID=1424756 RepID=A0ACC2WHE3_9TREE|nr:hypothetical protein QFC22_006579 [Naganishia vaughanmartiniae]